MNSETQTAPKENIANFCNKGKLTPSVFEQENDVLRTKKGQIGFVNSGN